jgi:hypothetical protein
MSGPHPFSDRCRHGSKRAKIRKETGIYTGIARPEFQPDGDGILHDSLIEHA